MRTFSVFTAVVLVLLIAAPAAAQAPPSSAITVGLDLDLAEASQRVAFDEAFRSTVGAATVDRPVTVVEGCDDVSFCVTVVAVPVRLGARAKGVAIAGYVARRLWADPQWPWPPEKKKEEAGGPPMIEDAYTAAGDGGCVECQSRLERVERQIALARSLVADTMVDEGDLQVAVGPSETAFVSATAADMATAVVDRHVRPWSDRSIR